MKIIKCIYWWFTGCCIKCGNKKITWGYMSGTMICPKCDLI